MKRVLVVAFLLLSARVQAQVLPIHNAPQGKATYASSSEWPAISGQCHWIPGDGTPAIQPSNTLTPDMAHTHAEFDAFPVWAELGNQSITVNVTFQLFHTAGKIVLVTGNYGGTVSTPYYIPIVMDTPGPYVGDPSGLVKFHGHMTFNVNDGLAAGVDPQELSAHGWGSILLFARTAYDNGDQVDIETVVPIYSVVDVQQPEAALVENSIPLGTKCTDVVVHDAQTANIFGIHLSTVRDQLLPLLAPFTAPIQTKAFGYNYSFDSGLPQDRPGVTHGTYQLLVDNDFHMGVAGTVNVPATVPDGNIGNFDTLDPLWIAQQTEPMSLKATNQHRLTFQWIVRTPDGGWTDQYGHPEPGGKELRSLLSVLVTVGPNPTGCSPQLCPPVPSAPPVVVAPPPVVPPPVTPPTVVTTTFAEYVKRTIVNGVVQPLQQCFTDDTPSEHCAAWTGN